MAPPPQGLLPRLAADRRARKLGLIYPRFYYPSGDIPLGVASVAAAVRQQRPRTVAHCDTTVAPGFAVGEEFLERERPDAVGVSLSTLSLAHGLRACAAAHRRGIPVFVGGPHATIAPRELLARPEVQAVVLGEGELTTVDLLRAWEDGGRRPVPGAWVTLPDGSAAPATAGRPVPDLDALPWPAWDLLPMERYIEAWGQLDPVQPGLRGVNLCSSRGCPFTCTFCQPTLRALFGPRFRQRSPEGVVQEIEALVARYRIQGFWFTDDTLTLDERWVRAFCAALTARTAGLRWGCTTRANLVSPELLRVMQAAGLRRLGLGLESASERIREGLYRKGVSLEAVARTARAAEDLGIVTLVFVMLGAPDERRGELLHTLRAAARLPVSEASITLFVPIPGTELHRRMVAQGIPISGRGQDFDYYRRQPFRGRLSSSELRAWQIAGYARFYARPARLWTLLRSVSNPQGRRSMGRKLRRLLPSR